MQVSLQFVVALVTGLTLFQVLINSKGTGYFQEKFTLNCMFPRCPPITKTTLAVRKLAEDLVRNDATLRSYLAYVFHVFALHFYCECHFHLLRGTLHVADNSSNVGRAMHIKDSILKSSQLHRAPDTAQDTWLASITKNLGYDLLRMRTAMSGSMKNGGGNL
jgi:hypothetical protein